MYKWIEERQQDAEQYGIPETAYFEAINKIPGCQDDAGVDNKQKQSKGEYGNRKGQYYQQRLYSRVQDRQQDGYHEGRKNIIDHYTRKDMRQDKGINRSNQYF